MTNENSESKITVLLIERAMQRKFPVLLMDSTKDDTPAARTMKWMGMYHLTKGMPSPNDNGAVMWRD